MKKGEIKVERLVMYSRPTDRFTAPYGTILEARMDTVELYVQTGQDKTRWMRMGEFLEKSYGRHIEEYINEALFLLEDDDEHKLD